MQMNHEQVDLDETECFSDFFLDYLAGKPELNAFYNYPPNVTSFDDQIREKHFPAARREILVSELNRQYENLEIPETVRNNIDALASEKTFTITTGHQLNIFTGPMYVIYKIITIIRSCEQLRSAYPEYEFVPVYWMASEDHDFAEINHFHFNGHKYVWNSDQQGAVGRFNLDDLQPLLGGLQAIPGFFHQAYRKGQSLADAVREYMTSLFGAYGLVVLDADNKAQKSLFRNVMEADVIDGSIAPVVRATTDELEALGYSTQVNARDINFFYLADEGRYRIASESGEYHLVDGDRSFSTEEMKNIIATEPERLSPNVVLRPLYQEYILPNLAYVGGPSELIYWLQLRGMFRELEMPFPILMPRNFGLVIPAHIERKRKSTHLSISEYFRNLSAILGEKVLDHTEHELSLQDKQGSIDEIFRDIYEQATSIDPTLGQHVEAQQAKLHKVLKKMEKKFIRAEKKNHDDLVRQITAVKEYIFPDGHLQERYENFLNFYQNDPDFIDQLMKLTDPFAYRFNIFTYGE